MTKYGEDIASIRTCVTAIKANIDETKADIKEIKDTLNGKDGLITVVEIVEGSTKKLWVICGSIGLLLITGLINMVFFGG